MSGLSDCINCVCSNGTRLAVEGIFTYFRRKREQKAVNICVRCCFAICACCCGSPNENNANDQNNAGPERMTMENENNSGSQQNGASIATSPFNVEFGEKETPSSRFAARYP